MNVEFRKYAPLRDYKKLMELVKSEGEEWNAYLKANYKSALAKSISYVAYSNEDLCGFSRSINDHDIYIWVVDLLVHNEFRGKSIGKSLMECLMRDFPDKDVFVLSDVDEYYHKIGYQKEGSIFKVG